MTERRSRLETKLDILRYCEKEMKPTRLMYAVNMSWRPLQRYVEDLIARGLIARKPCGIDERTPYVLIRTEKGTQLLKALSPGVTVLEGEKKNG